MYCTTARREKQIMKANSIPFLSPQLKDAGDSDAERKAAIERVNPW